MLTSGVTHAGVSVLGNMPEVLRPEPLKANLGWG